MEESQRDDLLGEIDQLRKKLQMTQDALEALKQNKIDHLASFTGEVGSDQERIDIMYRLVLENMSEGALVINEQKTILYANLRFSEFMGTPLQKIIGADVRSLVDEGQLNQLEKLLQQEPGQKSRLEVSLINKGTVYRNFLFSVSSFYQSAGKYHIVIATNLTEQKQAEEKLKKAKEIQINWNKKLEEKVKERTIELMEINKYLDNFVHAVAHDLRTPVANLTLTQKIFHKAPEWEKDKLFTMISKNIEKLDITLRGLVQIIDTQGKKELSEPDIDIMEIINLVLEEESDWIKQKNGIIKTSCNISPRINYVKGYLWSIVKNMVSNALKYSSPKRQLILDIMIDKKGDLFLITFTDNGSGIDLEKYKQDIFQPFKRFSSKEKGLGIGLHIINTMVRKNGGHIEVESEPGEGTTFKVFLKEYDV